MKTNICLLTCFFTFLFQFSDSQVKRAAHWYFGWQSGIDFSQGAPVWDTTGNMMTIEGSSAISDTSGNLLFYTNGEKVWDRTHVIMPNGSGLHGTQTSAQGVVIVPKPGNNKVYYIFYGFRAGGI